MVFANDLRQNQCQEIYVIVLVKNGVHFVLCFSFQKMFYVHVVRQGYDQSQETRKQSHLEYRKIC